jgi:hypothetical protein
MGRYPRNEREWSERMWWWWCGASLCDWKTLFPSHISSEGGGGGAVGNTPLCLTFQVREGVVVWLESILLGLAF